jgi:tripartite-type tricarboxylate transporter receptor subunit TctC
MRLRCWSGVMVVVAAALALSVPARTIDLPRWSLVMSGRIAVFLPTLGGHIGNVTAGRMRALAVSGASRAAQLPDIPTFNELGVKFVDETSWYALFAPRGTPGEIIAKVNADVERILATPDVKERVSR